jgi:hypothetical protein
MDSSQKDRLEKIRVPVLAPPPCIPPFMAWRPCPNKSSIRTRFAGLKGSSSRPASRGAQRRHGPDIMGGLSVPPAPGGCSSGFLPLPKKMRLGSGRVKVNMARYPFPIVRKLSNLCQDSVKDSDRSQTRASSLWGWRRRRSVLTRVQVGRLLDRTCK